MEVFNETDQNCSLRGQHDTNYIVKVTGSKVTVTQNISQNAIL